MAALFLVAVGSVGWIETSTWRQMERLRQDLGGANLESFFLGVHLRETVLRMNGALFRFQLSDDDAEREGFFREARELTLRLERTRIHLTTEAERRLVDQIEQSFALYRRETSTYLERGLRGIRKDTASLLNQQISEKSEALLGLAGQLVDAQQTALSRFLASSQAALSSMQRLLVLSILLLIVLIASVAALLHRIKVAPLQAKLSASQALLERQEKLASLGVLAAGVAHEVRNPLTAIKFRLFSLKKALPEPLADHEDLAIVHDEINRLERIVKGFLQFARPTDPELANVSVGQLLQETCDFLQAELDKRSIRISTEAGDSLSVRADRQQLRQVLINLVQNAADSIERQGTITLRARPGASSLLKQNQPAVIIDVTDTGKGISADVEKRLFDPFFSTKEGGTGLGLSIASRIVEKHGGFIQYLTGLNRGTTFSIVLPKFAADESASAPH